MSAEMLYDRRKELKNMIRTGRVELEEARKLHEKLYANFKRLQLEYELLEREIAELEGKIVVVHPFRCRAMRKTSEKINPMDALKAAMASMTDEERKDFLADLLE